MIYISYEELIPNRNYPKMRDSFEVEEYPNKKRIVEFLRNGTVDLAKGSRLKDVFDGEVIPDEVLIMSDGRYAWTNIIAWYVEKYNLRLPKDFEKYILEKDVKRYGNDGRSDKDSQRG